MDTSKTSYLYYEESYEVRKNQTGTVKYYTQMDTGESGMSLRGLANACGLGHKSLREFFAKTTIFDEVGGKTKENDRNSMKELNKEVGGKPDIYLIKTDDLHVIRDIFCEAVVYYYAFESQYKKTKAREFRRASHSQRHGPVGQFSAYDRARN